MRKRNRLPSIALPFLLATTAYAAPTATAPPAAFEALAGGQPVTLVESLRYALGHARELEAADIDAGVARLGMARARAGYLPRVDAGADLTMLSAQPGAIINGFPVNTADRDIFGIRVTAEQTLYDYGRTSARIGQADARADGANEAAAVARERQALEVIGAFITARRSEGLKAVAAESLVLAREHRKVSGDLYDQGSVARNDLLAADVSVANAEAALVAAENRVEIARSRLALRMGISGERAVLPDAGDIPVPLAAVPGQADSVLAASNQRREIRAQEGAIREGREAARAADAEFGPTFFGRAGYAYDSNGYNPNHNLFSLLIGGRINLFAGNADQVARRQAQRQVDRRESELALLKDTIALDVKAAHLALREAVQRREAAERAVTAATENLRIQDDRYREGIAISTEQIDAQTLLTRARIDLQNSTHDVFEARYRLTYTRGELMDYLLPLVAR
ncbi:MAG TPA: TolC family protein [Candidatus Deferrimicrobiaceae bacterium]|jgi:outer membrane protein TolC